LQADAAQSPLAHESPLTPTDDTETMSPAASSLHGPEHVDLPPRDSSSAPFLPIIPPRDFDQP
jgi:hypothetical protein